jgi:hypothetical protein
MRTVSVQSLSVLYGKVKSDWITAGLAGAATLQDEWEEGGLEYF